MEQKSQNKGLFSQDPILAFNPEAEERPYYLEGGEGEGPLIGPPGVLDLRAALREHIDISAHKRVSLFFSSQLSFFFGGWEKEGWRRRSGMVHLSAEKGSEGEGEGHCCLGGRRRSLGKEKEKILHMV